jgi:Rrf2 family protein
MKLTLSVSYGIGILLQILEHSGGKPLTAAKIARGCRFPPRFLYRVLHKLVDAGLLSGTSGPGGGYMLARRPELISLLDIVGGVESGLEPSMLAPVCTRQRRAIAHVNRLCRQSAGGFAAELSRVSLLDLERMVRGDRRAARLRGWARERSNRSSGERRKNRSSR